jgi:hypothetical protein
MEAVPRPRTIGGAAARALALVAALTALGAPPARALHFDVMITTQPGPVAGASIAIDYYGDQNLTGKLPAHYGTGYKIFTTDFGDLSGGPYSTNNPGFQAFPGTLLRREEIHFRAIGTLSYWSPVSQAWGAPSAGHGVRLFGGIPSDVVFNHLLNPADPVAAAQYNFYAQGTLFTGAGVAGPGTAPIDDAGRNGDFHAHLDWFVEGNGGAPAAGSYMVQLQLFSPTLVGGVKKYQDSSPFHVLFNRGLTDAQFNTSLSLLTSPPPPVVVPPPPVVVPPPPIPEPGTLVLLACGLAAVLLATRRRTPSPLSPAA